MALALLVASCSYGHRIAYHVLEGPLDAIAVSHLDPDKLLILAGDDDGKSVSVFHDSVHAAEILRFEVPRFTSDIQAGTNGKFYLSVAVPQDYDAEKHAASGAIEEWNLHGQMLSTMRFPAPVLAITRPVRGMMYALLETKGRPVAVGLRLADAKVLGTVVLGETTHSLDQCVLAGQVYLLTSSPRTHHVYLFNAKSGFAVDTGMVADRPRCFANSEAIAGIATHALSAEVAVLRLSLTAQRSASIVAPDDAVELEAASDGRMFLLRRFGSSSNVQIWTKSEVAGAGG